MGICRPIFSYPVISAALNNLLKFYRIASAKIYLHSLASRQRRKWFSARVIFSHHRRTSHFLQDLPCRIHGCYTPDPTSWDRLKTQGQESFWTSSLFNSGYLILMSLCVSCVLRRHRDPQKDGQHCGSMTDLTHWCWQPASISIRPPIWTV